MRTLRHSRYLFTLLLVLGFGAVGAASAQARLVAACSANPLLNNIPRGGEEAISWELCVITNEAGKWRAFVRFVGGGGRSGQHVLGRVHVELSFQGTRHALVNSSEVVEPVTGHASASITTRWHRDRARGWYCATLWNHDELGYYKIVPGEANLGGDREAEGARARRPHLTVADKWDSTCLSW